MNTPHALHAGSATLVLLCVLGLGGNSIIADPTPATDSARAEPQVRTLAAAAPATSRVLRQTRHADVDGDGRLDTIRIYKVGTTRNRATTLLMRLWRVKVSTAAGQAAWSPRFRSYLPGNRWWGSADLDGTPGRELLFVTGTEDFVQFVVLHWHGRALRFEKAPAGPTDPTTTGRNWLAASEVLRSGYRLFTYHGERYVNRWQADCPDHGPCTVTVMRSVWRHRLWQSVSVPPPTKVRRGEIYRRHPLGALVIHD